MANASSSLLLSVVIPTHNPRIDFLTRVIEALKQQTLPRERWELLLVDNGSRVPLKAAVGPRDSGSESSTAQRDNRSAGPQDCGTSLPSHLSTFPPFTELELGWHPNARIVREEVLGLTFARLRGFAEAKGELIVMVDDDNVLAPDYLESAVRIAQEVPGLGAFGGKCLPEFEVEPPEWLKGRGKGLGLRDRGDREELFPREHTADGGRDSAVAESGKVGKFECGKVKRAVREFPDCAPIGAGMVLRREAARAYAERLRRRSGLRVAGSESDGVSVAQAEQSPKHCPTELPKHRAASVITDRKGDSLASGGDNDICLTVIEDGWQVGYLPQLQLTHLIPKQRMTLDYHKRMARDSMKSFILMLDQHGIRPWPAMPKWTLPLRVASDWCRSTPWKGPVHLLRWSKNIGIYQGRAALPHVA